MFSLIKEEETTPNRSDKNLYYAGKLSKNIGESIPRIFKTFHVTLPKKVKRIARINKEVWIILAASSDIEKDKLYKKLKSHNIELDSIEIKTFSSSLQDQDWPVSEYKKVPRPHELHFEELDKETRDRCIYWFKKMKKKGDGIGNTSFIVDISRNELISLKNGISNKSHETILNHSPISAIRDASLKITETQYLCTGYDLFVYNEPCIMCSMAAVHARIKRIFFINPSVETGGLFSRIRLQDLKKINHKFCVFKYKEESET